MATTTSSPSVVSWFLVREGWAECSAAAQQVAYPSKHGRAARSARRARHVTRAMLLTSHGVPDIPPPSKTCSPVAVRRDGLQHGIDAAGGAHLALVGVCTGGVVAAWQAGGD